MIEITTHFENLKYKTPVLVFGKPLSENRFLKVGILGQDYFLSVLPGLHSSTLEEISYKLQFFFSHYQLNFEHIDFTKKFFNLVNLQDDFLNSITNEVLFNLEVILLGLVQKTHVQIFSQDTVKLNQVYSSQNDLSYYQDALVLKIKVTPENTKEVLSLMSELTKINPALIYRLDGNRRFELEDLIKLEVSLIEKNYRVDYFEEPLKNFYETTLFHKRSRIPVAIDESFICFLNEKNFSYPAVIKPSLMGISPVYAWLKNHPHNRAIISSSFEHPTVLLSLLFLARERPNEYHGLEDFFKL